MKTSTIRFPNTVPSSAPLPENSPGESSVSVPVGCAAPAASGRYRAWIELDEAALRHNAALLRSLLPEGCRLMPAVKADAYGHGAVPISKMLQSMGVDAFCVACIQEAILLREAGIRGDILILGYTHPDQFALLSHFDLIQTVLDYPYALLLNQYGRPLRIHLALDTGMHRLGEPCENLERLLKICNMENLKIEGLFTHLAASDMTSREAQAFTQAQIKNFYEVTGLLQANTHHPLRLHLQSSYGLLHYPGLAADYVRPGIVLYGTHSTPADRKNCSLPLKPVLSLKARIALLRSLEPGETAGYGLAFRALRPTRLAVLSIGYADGLPRSLSGGSGSVLIHGQKAPVIGRICMDQTLVDVTSIPGIRPNDTAVLIGRSYQPGEKSAEITACDMAEAAGTITNELLSRLGPRLPRIPV